ncbi:glycosyltransferase [Fictibacillus sp. KU28468]|uniref:glycosyltransferase n=1 Tax=Fictibacillus sp. KU28468 TaxID=2991053 RepID=UPI00223E7458|nr:glycosyltransferase [Fictibacillus sp. KU28468]UZJ77846.1 glycosyltransferase [Fictibacillus sp. KU28468]
MNDGSRDSTAEQLLKIRQQDHRVKLIEFSRNFGHQVAISAGMDHARGDAVIKWAAEVRK